MYNNPFDADWFRTLPNELYQNGLAPILINSALNLTPADEPFALLQEGCATSGERGSDFLRLILIEQLILRGNIQEAQKNIEQLGDRCRDNVEALRGWLSFLRGDIQQAIAYYITALIALKKITGKRWGMVPPVMAIILPFSYSCLISCSVSQARYSSGDMIRRSFWVWEIME